MIKIFVSYSYDDRNDVQGTFLSKLPAGAYDVTNPDDFSPGVDIRRCIRESIAGASVVVLFWSSAGAKSSWLGYEAGLARALDKPLVIVTRAGAPSLPVGLGDTVCVPWNAAALARALKSVTSAAPSV